MAEAIILAMVAITTAWSGYQAARWMPNSQREERPEEINAIVLKFLKDVGH